MKRSSPRMPRAVPTRPLQFQGLRRRGAQGRRSQEEEVLCTVESCFSSLSTKTKFQENSSVLFVFSDALLFCELYLLYLALLSFPGYLSNPAGVPWSEAVGLRPHGDCHRPSSPFSQAAPTPSFPRKNKGAAPVLPSATLYNSSYFSISGPGKPRATMEPSPEEILELAGDAGGSEEVAVGRWWHEQSGSVSLAQAPRMFDKMEFFGRTSSHHSFTFFFTFVVCVFIKSFEYRCLLLKGSIGCFAVEQVFGFLQIL